MKFTIRHRPDLKVTDRLVYEEMNYDITAMQHIKGRSRETLVMGKIVT